MSTATVAMTGASGFIGGAIAGRLCEEGLRLRLLLRDTSRTPLAGHERVEAVQGDLHDTAALARLVQGVDAVVHCAGAVRGASVRDFDRVNVEGTARLLEAMGTAPRVPGLLMLSSLAARAPELSFYAASKRKAEHLLEQAGLRRWLALRPPAVYGPGDREMLPLFRAMARGFAPIPGSRRARFSMLHVNDLVGLVRCWLDADDAPGGIHALHDGKRGGYDWGDVAGVMQAITGRRVRMLEIPRPLLDVPAWLNARLSPWFGHAPMLTPQKLRELRHPDWVCENSPQLLALGWRPALRLDTGLRTLHDVL
ncbi:MAG TPA: SDR family NAD(P)-dependent oxidoreductase [Gammaproteobacteria bacterium]|nr:SDR family NAD(P)-dependent oxidoreductase [Gammaproteobacteria bacterium]